MQPPAFCRLQAQLYSHKAQYSREKLKKAIVSPDDTMNFTGFEGADINVKEVIDLAETMPFFAERRLILIEDSKLFKKGGDELGEYLATLPEATYFVFVEEEVDKRSKLFKAVTKCGNAVEFGTQTDETLMRWVGNRISKEGKNITQAAYQTFISKTGTDMENIEKEYLMLRIMTFFRYFGDCFFYGYFYL